MRGAELGEFLRSRRGRVDPTDAGFPSDRRRTPGLRREELASLAGVTVSWLAKLEQGNAHSVSQDVLAALARALRLDDAERTHLFALAGYRVDGAAADATVTDALRELLAQLEPNPAYLLDRSWNIVAWNAAEAELFAPLARWHGPPPNLLELVFANAELASLMADHNEELVRLVAQFRLHCAEWPHDPEIEALIKRLRSSSKTFAALWDAKDVRTFSSTRRVFEHPTRGQLVFDHHRLAVLDQPGMGLVIYTPSRH